MATVGDRVRAARRARGWTLADLAERVGCGKSWLSQIENGRRGHPPSEELLRRIERAMGMEGGELVRAAAVQQMPREVKEDVRRLEMVGRDARRLVEALRGSGGLDGAFASGALQRLVNAIAPEGVSNVELLRLSANVPLINKVAAGYPREFTDLGYPARVAEEYVSVPGVTDADAFAARVVGDSMAPEYVEGDVVVFSPERDAQDGSDCFVRLERDGETTFKRVYFERGAGEDEGEAIIRLQPLNARYPAKRVRREEVAGLYAAVSVIRAVGR